MDKIDSIAPAASDEQPGEKSAKGRRGRPVGDREAKRKELLRAGIKVIADLGYAGASLRKVAKEAGHTTGAITYYFEDKEAMVRAIIEHMFDEFDDMLELGDEITDMRKRFRRWIELNSDSDAWLASFQLLARARHEPAFAAIYQQRYQGYRDRLAGIIAKQQAAGVTRNDISADMLADHLSSIGDGWMMLLPIEPARFSTERIEALIDSITVLLAPQRP